MLKFFIFSLFGLLFSATDTGASDSGPVYLPYNPQWSGFQTMGNLENVVDESDGQGMLLPEGPLKPGQYISFSGEADFAQVMGPGTNPVFQTGEMDVPAQIINGRIVPVAKPDNDGDVAVSPQFQLPSTLSAITTLAGAIPSAPALPGMSQQFPFFVSDELDNLYKFQGYGCLDGDCEVSDLFKAMALGGQLSGLDSQGLFSGIGNTGAAVAPPAAPAAPVTAPAASVVSPAAVPPATAPAAPNANANAKANFDTLMMLTGGDNPLNNEETNMSPAAQNYLKTLPGGNLIAMYGNVEDSVYGESDAFKMVGGKAYFNWDNVDGTLPDRVLQANHKSEPVTQVPYFTEDPFFWCFLFSLVLLLSGISIMLFSNLNQKKTLDEILLEVDEVNEYSSHV